MEENKIILSTKASYDSPQEITKEQLDSIKSLLNSLAIAFAIKNYWFLLYKENPPESVNSQAGLLFILLTYWILYQQYSLQ